MGAEHRRGPGSDGLRRKVVAVGVPPGKYKAALKREERK